MRALRVLIVVDSVKGDVFVACVFLGRVRETLFFNRCVWRLL